jgi:hypothetical protein
MHLKQRDRDAEMFYDQQLRAPSSVGESICVLSSGSDVNLGMAERNE